MRPFPNLPFPLQQSDCLCRHSFDWTACKWIAIFMLACIPDWWRVGAPAHFYLCRGKARFEKGICGDTKNNRRKRKAWKRHVYWLWNEAEAMGLHIKKYTTSVWLFLKIASLKASSLNMYRRFACNVFISKETLRGKEHLGSTRKELGCDSLLARSSSRRSCDLSTCCKSILAISTQLAMMQIAINTWSCDDCHRSRKNFKNVSERNICTIGTLAGLVIC